MICKKKTLITLDNNLTPSLTFEIKPHKTKSRIVISLSGDGFSLPIIIYSCILSMLTICKSKPFTLEKPFFGSFKYKGVWPPSKPRGVRPFCWWPFPQFFPLPDPVPRPFLLFCKNYLVMSKIKQKYFYILKRN